MSEELNSPPEAAPADSPKPARRKAAARAPRRKAAAPEVAEALSLDAVPAESAEPAQPAEAVDAPAKPAKAPRAPRAKAAPKVAKPAPEGKPARSPRKAKPKAAPTVPEELAPVADLFAVLPDLPPMVASPVPPLDAPLFDAVGLSLPEMPAPEALAEPAPAEAVPVQAEPQEGRSVALPEDLPLPGIEPLPHQAEVLAVLETPRQSTLPSMAEAEQGAQVLEVAEVAAAEGEAHAAEAGEAGEAARRKRKRRRGRRERDGQPAAELPYLTQPTQASLEEQDAPDAPAAAQALPEAEVAAPIEAETALEAEAEAPAALRPLCVLSLGLEAEPRLSDATLARLRSARLILGSADALDRIAPLAPDVPQRLCANESVHLDLRETGTEGCVLVVAGDGAGDGPATELLAELGPGAFELIPGVGRVQAACAALGLSAEIVNVVDLRRAPVAALRGRLRAHALLAVPVADALLPVAIARQLVDGGFPEARVWVCEFAGGPLRIQAWLAPELAELRDALDPRAVLIIATGPNRGHYPELPGLGEGALGGDVRDPLPLAVRTLSLAWLQPAAWETGWVISEGEPSLALEWARAVPTARVRAVGSDPTVLGVLAARAGVGDNLSAVAAAQPLRCREWSRPEAAFIRGAAGLPEWLDAVWARLAPGGRLVVSAEDDQARADLLAFASRHPAEAWEELSLSRGVSVAGRLRFEPAAPVRLALWRKPLEA